MANGDKLLRANHTMTGYGPAGNGWGFKGSAKA